MSKESFLEDLSALLSFPILEDSFLGIFFDWLPKQMEIGFSKIKQLNFILCLSNIPQEFELHHCMASTAQTASIPHVINGFVCDGEQNQAG